MPSPLAMQKLEDLLRVRGDRGQELLLQYGGASGSTSSKAKQDRE